MKRSLKKITVKELASLIGKHLKKHGIEAVLTGGACVTIYSKNKYRSYDLDFVTSAVEGMPKQIKEAMDEVGFTKTAEGYFANPDCPYFIEFISPPLAAGKEPLKDILTQKTKLGSFKILSPTDCVKDRLAHFYHWNDRQALEQARMVAQSHKVNFKELKRWSKVEGHLEKYAIFAQQIAKKKA